MPGIQIINPRGAFPVSGSTVAQSKIVGNVTDEFVASTTVTATKVVSIATDGTYQVAVAATNGTASLAIGVSLNAAVAGGSVDVTTHGLARSVPVDGAVAAGDTLKRSVTTAGSLATTASPATGEAFGVALAASASNVVDVWVLK